MKNLEKISERAPAVYTRRQFVTFTLSLGFVTLCGCRKPFTRAPAVYDLGAVKDLLFEAQMIQEASILVTHDQRGWAAMSTRCTYDGCDLSYQESELLCMCCSAVYLHTGEVYSGPPTYPLPYFEMSFRDDHLFADTEKIVRPDTRFSAPELERALLNLRDRLRVEGARPGAKIPEALLGKGGETKEMFQEQYDVVVPSLTEGAADPNASPTPSLFQRLMKVRGQGTSAETPAPSPTPMDIPGLFR